MLIYKIMEDLLRKFLYLRWIKKTDKMLVICGNKDDETRLKNLSINKYLITSIDKKVPGVKHYQQADAQKLPFADQFFDIAIVNGGLHHCDSPHLALNEMYRVAKKAVIVNESQDSLLVRFLVRLKIIWAYEISSLDGHGGGLNSSPIPNFIYRWTKRDVIKTINSFDPTRKHHITFFSQFLFHQYYLDSGSGWDRKTIVRVFNRHLLRCLINLLVKILNLVARNQGNDFAFIIRKDIAPSQPWVYSKNKSSGLPGRARL